MSGDTGAELDHGCRNLAQIVVRNPHDAHIGDDATPFKHRFDVGGEHLGPTDIQNVLAPANQEKVAVPVDVADVESGAFAVLVVAGVGLLWPPEVGHLVALGASKPHNPRFTRRKFLAGLAADDNATTSDGLPDRAGLVAPTIRTLNADTETLGHAVGLPNAPYPVHEVFLDLRLAGCATVENHLEAGHVVLLTTGHFKHALHHRWGERKHGHLEGRNGPQYVPAFSLFHDDDMCACVEGTVQPADGHRVVERRRDENGVLAGGQERRQLRLGSRTTTLLAEGLCHDLGSAGTSAAEQKAPAFLRRRGRRLLVLVEQHVVRLPAEGYRCTHHDAVDAHLKMLAHRSCRVGELVAHDHGCWIELGEDFANLFGLAVSVEWQVVEAPLARCLQGHGKLDLVAKHEGDPVPLPQSEGLKGRGESPHLHVQLGVSDRSGGGQHCDGGCGQVHDSSWMLKAI